MWFPIKERGFATSTYITGQYVGTPIFAAMLLWVAQDYGWRSVFYFTGGAGVLLGFAWWFIYQDPLDCKRANKAELDHIASGGGLVTNPAQAKFDWKAVFVLLKQRQVLAICLGKYCSNTVLVFFTTWFLTFLVEERKMTMIKVGFFQILPFLGATTGILLAGLFSDLMIRRGMSMSAARKLLLSSGLCWPAQLSWSISSRQTPLSSPSSRQHSSRRVWRLHLGLRSLRSHRGDKLD